MTAALVGAALVLAVAAGLRGTWSPCGLSMLSSITPMSERARGHRYGVTCAWFVAGSTVGGALLGLVAALGAAATGTLPDAAGRWLVAVGVLVALVCVASDVRVGPVRLPLLPRQVDEAWLEVYRRWIYAAGFGVQIGAGFTTYVMTAATYLVLALAVLSGAPGWAFGTGLLFGFVRGLVVLAGTYASTPARLRDLHRTLERHATTSLRVVVGVQAAVAVALAAVAGGALAAGAVLVLVGALVAVSLRRERRAVRPGAPSAVVSAPDLVGATRQAMP